MKIMNMTRRASKHWNINSELTKRVIELHDSGFEFDFKLVDNDGILCVQDNRRYLLNDIVVKIIDQVYDHFSGSFKYVHTIDTCCGILGLLIIEGICISGLYDAAYPEEACPARQLSA